MAKGKRNAIDNVERQEAPPNGTPTAPEKPPEESTEDMLARMKRESQFIIWKQQLQKPFDPGQIKWLPKIVKNNRCLAIAYIDARLVEDRLDEVFGPGGWSSNFEKFGNDNVMCHLSCFFGDDEFDGSWVMKSDVGGYSDQPDPGDKMKAAVSDALKRAAVQFGIGRYLYRIPPQWVDYDPVAKKVVGSPRLPPFAIPKKTEAEPARYHFDEPTDAPEPQSPPPPPPPPAAAAKKEPPRKEPEKPKVDEAEVTQQRVTHWMHELTGCENYGQLNDLLPDLADEPGFAKQAIWDLICKTAKDVGWAYDKTAKRFYDPTPTDAIPF